MELKCDPNRATALREIAEAQLGVGISTALPDLPPEKLLHELRVHQVELEMQNDELRQTQLALTNSRDRYVDLYEFAPVGYLTIADTGLIVEANLTAATLVGLERTVLLQRRFDSMVVPQLRDQWGRQFVSLLRHDGEAAFDLMLRHANGTVFHVQVNGHCVSSGGSVKSVRLALTDVTERVRAQEDLVRSEARLKSLLDSAMDAVIIVDENQHIVLLNIAAEVIFGCSRARVVGSPLTQFIPERFRQEHVRQLERFGNAGTTTRHMGGGQGIVMARRSNGEEFPIEASISQVSDGHRKFFTVILRDVTERVLAEDGLRKSQEELREFSAAAASLREQEKKRIARELHDELGQALTTLKMDVIWATEHLPADQRELAQRLDQMLITLDHTVAATRRIAADLRPLILDDLGFTAAAEWLVQNFKERHDINCQLKIAEPDLDLPEPYATTVFRILQESLTNVAKHAHATSVNVSLDQANGTVWLCVIDNGRGFVATDPRKPESYGLLGLRERVLLMGGDVWIESGPGRGTRIEVRISIAGWPSREK